MLGLTFAPTGATVAALTTSLPETPRGERNWDYRYSWMRDSTFTLQALHWLNLDWEAEEFIEFIADLEPRTRTARCASCTASTADGTSPSPRATTSQATTARPVRIGNGAFDQRQNDVFGAVLDSILLHPPEPAALTPLVADRPGPGGVRHEGGARSGIWEARGHRSTTSLRS